MSPMAMTLSEKIIARACGQPRVAPGEIVTCQVDMAMMHDSSGPRRQAPKLEELGVGPWDADKVVVITDHFVTESDADSVSIQAITRDWVAANGIRRYHEAEGICHVMMPQGGHLAPGQFLVGGDSHSPTAGAFGCFMVGIGATELAGVLATGEIWIRVPQTLRVDVTGALREGVAAKDVILQICGRIGIMGANYKVVEFTGSGVDSMGMDERMTLTNMTAELGAKTGIIAPDVKTVEALANVGVTVSDAHDWVGDAGAPVSETSSVDADALAPQVAAPSSPENAGDVSAVRGVALDQAFIGACTGGKLDDLRMAARVLDGASVKIPLYVTPASVRIREQAREEGVLQVLEAAGAVITDIGCGACIGLGPARLGEDRTGISASSRNFTGRMGARSSRTYLASAYTVAASAIEGQVADPREHLDS